MIRIGSRGSALALWQSRHVADHLRAVHSGVSVDVEIIQTTGDRILDVPLARIGDKGLFTKELDRALLDGRIDAAVHSLKDVPTEVEPGLVIAAVTKRENPSDALVVAPGMAQTIPDLPAGARVGTSSLRRRAQLLAWRPDLSVLDLRGNVDTRLAQVEAGNYDAIILALAGITRLGLAHRAADVLNGERWLPAVGQGALGIVCRAEDARTKQILDVLNDAASLRATAAERAFLRELEGGCQVPIAALGTVDGESVQLRGLVASLDGKRVLRGEQTSADPRRAGQLLAQELLRQGAGEMLAEIRAAADHVTPPAAP